MARYARPAIPSDDPRAMVRRSRNAGKHPRAGRRATSETAMSYESFHVDIRDQVAHVTLSRPDALNSMNRAFWKELPEIVQRLDESAAARAIVLSSTGRHFTAGMDLSVFTSGPDLAGKEVG